MYTAERRDVLGCTSPTTKRFPEAREMSRGGSPRDISRAEGNLEVEGDVQPNSSWLEALYGHSLIINPSQGMYQEIHPCRASSIGSFKINTAISWENDQCHCFSFSRLYTFLWCFGLLGIKIVFCWNRVEMQNEAFRRLLIATCNSVLFFYQCRCLILTRWEIRDAILLN